MALEAAADEQAKRRAYCPAAGGLVARLNYIVSGESEEGLCIPAGYALEGLKGINTTIREAADRITADAAVIAAKDAEIHAKDNAGWAAADCIAKLQAEVEALRSVFTGPGCCIFLDGRNEHGSHVIMSLPTNLPETAQSDIEECAEEILAAAEALGFEVGRDHVWCLFRWNKPEIGEYGRVEFPGYWEFDKIDPVVTRAALTGGADG